jgi:spore germination protein GerM
MKVFIVFEEKYHDGINAIDVVDSVFDSEKKAKAYIAEVRKVYNKFLWIDEFEVK